MVSFICGAILKDALDSVRIVALDAAQHCWASQCIRQRCTICTTAVEVCLQTEVISKAPVQLCRQK